MEFLLGRVWVGGTDLIVMRLWPKHLLVLMVFHGGSDVFDFIVDYFDDFRVLFNNEVLRVELISSVLVELVKCVAGEDFEAVL